MALGMDPRFDLTHAYWVLAGISGFDPNDASLGSACWVDWVVDGDLSHSIDIREAPEGWSTGRFPFRATEPYGQPRPASEGSVFELNQSLSDWAFELTSETELLDTEALQKRRALFSGFPNAQRPPFVLQGSYLSAMNYWHGELENEWANRWVSYWTDGGGEFVASAMEGSGMMTSMIFLQQAERADLNRVLMLRTASNFTMQWPGATAHESKTGEKIGTYSAYLPSLDAAYRVASPVVLELANNWEKYRVEPPQ